MPQGRGKAKLKRKPRRQLVRTTGTVRPQSERAMKGVLSHQARLDLAMIADLRASADARGKMAS